MAAVADHTAGDGRSRYPGRLAVSAIMSRLATDRDHGLRSFGLTSGIFIFLSFL